MAEYFEQKFRGTSNSMENLDLDDIELKEGYDKEEFEEF